MIIKLFFFTRFGLLYLTYLASLLMPKIANSAAGAIAPGKSFNYWQSWAQWDGGHFGNIARNGYRFVSDYAYLPLYPLLVRPLAIFFGGNFLISGLVISNLCFWYSFFSYTNY